MLTGLQLNFVTGEGDDIFKRSARRRRSRIANDFYPSETGLTKGLLKAAPRITQVDRIFEPCAGRQDIAKVLRKETSARVFVSDLTWNDTAPRDATTDKFWNYWVQCASPQVVVTNPPFNVAAEILRHSWERCSIGCVFLLPLNFMEPVSSRGGLLDELADHMTLFMPVGSPRPRFRSDTKGTAPISVAWCGWTKEHSWQALGMEPPFKFLRNWK